MNRFSYRFFLIPKTSITFFGFLYLSCWYPKHSIICFKLLKTNLWPLFMDRVQLSQGYKVILRRYFTFDHYFPRNLWYWFDWPLKDERQSWPWNHPALLNLGPLNLGSKVKTNNEMSIWNDPRAGAWFKDAYSLICFKGIVRSFHLKNGKTFLFMITIYQA